MSKMPLDCTCNNVYNDGEAAKKVSQRASRLGMKIATVAELATCKLACYNNVADKQARRIKSDLLLRPVAYSKVICKNGALSVIIIEFAAYTYYSCFIMLRILYIHNASSNLIDLYIAYDAERHYYYLFRD